MRFDDRSVVVLGSFSALPQIVFCFIDACGGDLFNLDFSSFTGFKSAALQHTCCLDIARIIFFNLKSVVQEETLLEILLLISQFDSRRARLWDAMEVHRASETLINRTCSCSNRFVTSFCRMNRRD